ncbi:MAG: ribbon-helix-helix domain-containing protein [Halanaerobiales bacterium]|nr:ribbon-helix-helix domain-containing protein [Halanaerobiales bacterium]
MALKNRTKVTTTIKNELVEKLDTLNNKTRIPKSKLFDEALELLFEEHDDKFKD